MQAGARLAEREPAAVAGAGRTETNSRPQGSEVRVAGGYRLGNVLSRNSRIVVYEASRNGRRYALKLARAEGREAARARLAEEYRLASMLRHPNIATPRAWIAEPGATGIVFDYYPGGDLVSLTGANPCHWARALRDVARALRYMHGHGLVHRDVKARNVMFDSVGRAVLIDLGSCQAVGARWSAGGTTAEHRRPGRPRTVESSDDVYAYAILMREMLGPGDETVEQHAARRRLRELVTATVTGGGEDGDAKLGAFEAVLQSVSEKTRST